MLSVVVHWRDRYKNVIFIKCAAPPQVYLRYQVANLYSSETVNTRNRDPLGKVVRAEEKTMDQCEQASVQTVCNWS